MNKEAWKAIGKYFGRGLLVSLGMGCGVWVFWDSWKKLPSIDEEYHTNLRRARVE